MLIQERSNKRLNLFDFCDKNLQFTADTFDNSNIHSLGIKILNNETDIYINNANTGLIISIVILTIEIPKRHWYVHCIIKHSNQQLFMTRVHYLKKTMSWNCYHSSVKNKLIKQLQSWEKYQQKNEDQDIQNLPVLQVQVGKVITSEFG